MAGWIIFVVVTDKNSAWKTISQNVLHRGKAFILQLASGDEGTRSADDSANEFLL